jgi:hypothetical protein
MPEWLDGMCIRGAAVVEETHVMPNEKARRPPRSVAATASWFYDGLTRW